MIGKLYKDQIGKKIRFPINVVPPHDGNEATNVILNITKPSGATQVWSTTIISQNSTKIVVEKQVVAGDLDEVGNYSYAATVSGASGLIDTSDRRRRLLVRSGS